MSKIWVNGAEIDLATLTPEEISALTHSENLDYIKPDGLYYSNSISGDGSFDSPYGVSKLPNALTVTVLGENGEVIEKTFDGSEDTRISIADYRSVVDNNTIVGNGTEKSPIRVSDNLLLSIDSAYTMSIQTAQLIDGLEDTIESVLDFQEEVSAKCDSAIAIANSANTTALYAEFVSESAMSVAMSASTDVDKLYEFVSTLIYNITYDDENNCLIITYVDGTTSNVEINDITLLEEAVSDLSAYTRFIQKEVDDIKVDLKNVVIDVNYDSENSSLKIDFLNGTSKTFTLDDIIEMKNVLNNVVLQVSANSEAISALSGDSKDFSGYIETISQTIVSIQEYLDNAVELISANTEDIRTIGTEVQRIGTIMPKAVQRIDYINNSNTIVYENISGDSFEIVLSSLTETQEELENSVKSVVYSGSILTVTYNNGKEAHFQIKQGSDTGKTTTTATFTISPNTPMFYVSLNGDLVPMVNDSDKPADFPVEITGNSVAISFTGSDAPVESISLGGLILETSDISNQDNITAVTNAILPSNCTSMFEGDSNLTNVNVNLDMLINGEDMFKDCTELKAFDCNLKSLIIAPSMFENCISLTGFSTDMPMLREADSMFLNCVSISSLTSLNLKRLEEGKNMFANCENLKSVSDINLERLVDGTGMFSDSTKMSTNSIYTPNLKYGDYMYVNNSFSEYNVQDGLGRLESASYMFAGNENLAKFSTKKLQNLEYANGMFSGCTGLTVFDVDNCFTSLIEADYMFAECSKLDNVSTKWNLDDLIKANNMFENCSALTSFDVDMDSLREANNMFENCVGLTGITADVKSLTSAKDMFKGCSALTYVILKNLGCDLDLTETKITKAILSKLAGNAQDFKETKKTPTITLTSSQISTGDTAYTRFTEKGWTVEIK